MRNAERAVPPPIPESKASRKGTEIRANAGSRTSKDHEGCEDADLGNLSRIHEESLKEIPLHTKDKGRDMAAIREAGKVEAENAKKLRELGVHGIFDGVSGESNGSGQIASRIASGRIAEHLGKLPKDADPETTRRAIVDAMTSAHEAVRAHRGERDDLKAMATTGDVIRTFDNGDGSYDVAYGHIGDGRIYVFDGTTGKLRVETIDDGVAKYEMEQGNFSREEYDMVMNATSVDALPVKLQLAYRHRNAVTSVIGKEEMFAVASGIITLKKGDRMLISTDGIHDNLTDAQIEKIIADGDGVDDIIAAAGAVADGGKTKNARAKMDDITGKLIAFGEAKKDLELDITIEDEDENTGVKKKILPPPIPKAALKKSADAAKVRDDEKAKDLLKKIQAMIDEELNRPEKAA